MCAGRMKACGSARRLPPTATCASIGCSTPWRRPAPKRCTRATAFSPRTPSSPRPWPTAASPSLAPASMPSPAWATRSPPSASPRRRASTPFRATKTSLKTRTTPWPSHARSAIRSCSRPAPGAAARACAWCTAMTSAGTASSGRPTRPNPASATTGCLRRSSLNSPGTSKFKSSRTATVTPSTLASANVQSSAATRRSSRSRRRRSSTPPPARPWASRRSPWPGPWTTRRRAPWNSSLMRTGTSTFWK